MRLEQKLPLEPPHRGAGPKVRAVAKVFHHRPLTDQMLGDPHNQHRHHPVRLPIRMTIHVLQHANLSAHKTTSIGDELPIFEHAKKGIVVGLVTGRWVVWGGHFAVDELIGQCALPLIGGASDLARTSVR